ncbi:MAG: hypothetical protein M0Z69_14380 [Actinomycetota bacterium]|nr:hypothetical protein [Actinomycetota bacterium]
MLVGHEFRVRLMAADVSPGQAFRARALGELAALWLQPVRQGRRVDGGCRFRLSVPERLLLAVPGAIILIALEEEHGVILCNAGQMADDFLAVVAFDEW